MNARRMGSKYRWVAEVVVMPQISDELLLMENQILFHGVALHRPQQTRFVELLSDFVTYITFQCTCTVCVHCTPNSPETWKESEKQDETDIYGMPDYTPQILRPWHPRF